MDHIKICDYGDVDVLWGSVDVTFDRIRMKVKQILDSGASPIALAGDHSITYPILAAFREHSDKKIGVIHFDSTSTIWMSMKVTGMRDAAQYVEFQIAQRQV